MRRSNIRARLAALSGGLRFGDTPRTDRERVAMLRLELQAERVWVALLDRAASERRVRKPVGRSLETQARADAAADRARAIKSSNPTLTQEQIAERLGCAQQSVSRYLAR